MDTERMIVKFKELTHKRSRAVTYAHHLERQAIRLDRISRLLRCTPEEARECMELAVEYLLGEGILKKGMIKLPRKRIQADISDEVKMFLVQNGLCE